MTKKILLADDSVTIQKVVQLTFPEDAYDVTCVSDGSAALGKVREIQPDVVLLDTIMPGESGYDVCEAIKRDPATSHTPVLLLSGTFEPFDRQRAARSGADGHLTKPFESQALLAKVHELVERRAETPAPIPAPEPAPPRSPEPSTRPPEPAQGGGVELTPAVLDEIARRVAERLGESVIREIAMEVVPELAERLVRDRIREIEEEAGGPAEE